MGNQPPLPKHEKSCAVCGKIFVPTAGPEKCCSKKCADDRKQARARERYAARRQATMWASVDRTLREHKVKRIDAEIVGGRTRIRIEFHDARRDVGDSTHDLKLIACAIAALEKNGCCRIASEATELSIVI